MDDASRSLARFEPEGIAAEGQGWQQRKSAQTRVAILEAAIDCLEQVGYARTTTQLIAQTAGISRGAMLHHYATKQELIASVIGYTFHKRIGRFVERIHDLSDEQRVQQVAGVELYWETLLSREFTAFLELQVASRTDAELREIFLPKAREYDQVERREVLRAFPEWEDNPNYGLAMDFVIASIEGVLLNRDIWNSEERCQQMRRLVARALLPLRAHQFDEK
ncbi:TetR/AcrR family transcriptional regulator [Phenylobacterium montanum]|uniref:TetR/AcrR family transcriptional regulator n=1 Tax=Phenylobacterium montanum TaxID=2823693 RepID=A0A975IX33_9CAUL|nr:TetR/AcrR family transcriptional regulator [Caulobacter sp. S6]QUD90528.1 TetR/AcrR family transcriptional regulator [Caulobacter sp. S6]